MDSSKNNRRNPPRLYSLNRLDLASLGGFHKPVVVLFGMIGADFVANWWVFAGAVTIGTDCPLKTDKLLASFRKIHHKDGCSDLLYSTRHASSTLKTCLNSRT